MRKLFWILIITGAIMIFWGSINWFFKVQVHLDENVSSFSKNRKIILRRTKYTKKYYL